MRKPLTYCDVNSSLIEVIELLLSLVSPKSIDVGLVIERDGVAFRW
jgi:hypothetical protein